MSDDTLKSVCCDSMARQLNWSCDEHSSPFECPDVLVSRFKDNRIGLLIHDGGTSQIEISYCPWCGASLVPK
jgi:hypothetical protein